MKEEKTSSKKRVIYYVILGICAALLITAIVLTVYFVTRGTTSVVENPPPVDGPDDPKDPDDNPDDPPVSGDAVTFVSPIERDIKTAFYEMFENVTMNYWYYFHEGVDYLADVGTEVVAIADGTVTYVDNDEYLGYEIRIQHEDGFESRYHFAAPVSGLKAGDKVEQGQTIATVAEEEGNEKFLGPHLHFEMLKAGEQVDPAAYLDIVLEEK